MQPMRAPVVSAYARSSYRSWTRRLSPRSPLPAPKGAAAAGGAHAGGGEGHAGGFGEGHGSFDSGGGHSGGGDAGISEPYGDGGVVEPVPVPVFAPGLGKSSATSFDDGVAKVSTISAGQQFAGRTYGGSTRQDIYGSWYVLLEVKKWTAAQLLPWSHIGTTEVAIRE